MSNKELNICVHSPTAVAELEMPHYGQDKTGPGGWCPAVPCAMAGVPSKFSVPASTRSLGQADLPCGTEQCGPE